MSRRIENSDEDRIVNMDDIETVDIRTVATTQNNIVQTSSAQQVQCRNNNNFMQLPQQRFNPGNSNIDRILANNIVEQSEPNRALANIMQNAVTFRSEGTDYFSQNINFVDNLNFNRTVPLNYGNEMKVDENAQMNEIRQNMAKLNAFEQTLNDNKIDMDQIKVIGKDYEKLLTERQSIGNIVKIDAAEHKVNTLMSNAEYKITRKNVKDAVLFLAFQNNATILSKVREILGRLDNIDANVTDFFLWLLKYYINPTSDEAEPSLGKYYDLLTILNFVVSSEMKNNGINDAKKLQQNAVTVIAAKIINTVVTYYTALNVDAARMRSIKDFDQLIEALQDVARDYVIASPQLVNAVRGMSNIMNNWQYLTQNDQNFQQLFNTVFGQLNTFVVQGNISSQNFQTINDNFNNLFQRYQQFYGSTVGEHYKTTNQFAVIQEDIAKIKQLFAILTGQSNLNEIACAVNQIFNVCREVFQNNGFSNEQAYAIKGIVEEAGSCFQNQIDDVDERIKALKNRFDAEIEKVSDRNRQLEEHQRIIDAMKQQLDSIKTFLGDSVNNKATFSDMLNYINNNIKELKEITQNHGTRITSIETDMVKMKADASSLSEKVNRLTEKYTGDYITKQELEDFKRQIVDTYTEQQEIDMERMQEIIMRKVRNEMTERIDNINVAMKRTVPEYATNLSNVEKAREAYNTFVEKNHSFENKFTKLYKDILPDKAEILNDLTRNIDYGITLSKYIDMAKKGINYIKTDIGEGNLKLDVNEAGLNNDKILKITLLLYVSEVLENLFDYKDIAFSIPTEKGSNIYPQDTIAGCIKKVRQISTALCSSDLQPEAWNSITETLNTLIQILMNIKLNSDTTVENMMNVIKTTGEVPTYEENEQKAWSIIVASCNMLENSSANDPVTVYVNRNITLSRADLIRIIKNTVKALPNPHLAKNLENIVEQYEGKQISEEDFDRQVNRFFHTLLKIKTDDMDAMRNGERIKRGTRFLEGMQASREPPKKRRVELYETVQAQRSGR